MKETIPPKVSIGGTATFLAMMLVTWYLGNKYDTRFDNSPTVSERGIDMIDTRSQNEEIKDDAPVAIILKSDDQEAKKDSEWDEDQKDLDDVPIPEDLNKKGNIQ